MQVALYLCEKIGLPVMGDKTLFVRPGHNYDEMANHEMVQVYSLLKKDSGLFKRQSNYVTLTPCSLQFNSTLLLFVSFMYPGQMNALLLR